MLTVRVKENRRAWIDGLRSGKYTQTTNFLRTDDGGGFCVLGVASDVTGVREWDGSVYKTKSFHPKQHPLLPPQEVLAALGLRADDIDDERFLSIITNKNDSGIAFPELADEIECYLA